VSARNESLGRLPWGVARAAPEPIHCRAAVALPRAEPEPGTFSRPLHVPAASCTDPTRPHDPSAQDPGAGGTNSKTRQPRETCGIWCGAGSSRERFVEPVASRVRTVTRCEMGRLLDRNSFAPRPVALGWSLSVSGASRLLVDAPGNPIFTVADERTTALAAFTQDRARSCGVVSS
jgi:hypothetical protein